MASINEIKNLALFTLGFVDEIDFTDLTNATVQKVNRIYDTSKDFVMSNYFWRFAQKRAELEVRIEETDTFTAYTITGTFTANATTNVITSTRALANGDIIRLTNAGGALPAGLAINTNYYVISSTGLTCQLSLTLGGAAIDITDTGTGTHTLTMADRVTFSRDVSDNLEVVLSSAGTLPAGLSGRYYIVNTSDNICGLSLTPRGNAVAITSGGTGIHTATFQAVATSPFKYVYPVPSDFLVLRAIYQTRIDSTNIKRFELDNAGVHTDRTNPDNTIWLWYVADVPEEDYPVYFVDYFKYKLALDLCFNLTGDTNLLQLLKGQSDLMLISAKNVDAKQNPTRTIKSTPYLSIRR